VYRSVGTRVLAMGGVTMVGALIVVAFAARRVNRLQRQIERQRLSEQRNRQDLERLSARLVEAQEQERRSLARELHDAVGQALTAVKMDIGIALRAEASGRVREALEDAREITETTLRGVRDLSQLLHPSTLDDFGLPATLTAYLRSFSQRTGIRAQLMETLESRLPPEVETCAYRIVQEALNNIARHSDARSCTVWLSIVSRTLHLRIEDDGKGLVTVEPGTGADRGLGLIGMRERAQTLGGAFHIETGRGEGTRLLVTVPLPDEQPSPTPGQMDEIDIDSLAG
jgi:signal transduction histidine kinase